MQCHGTVKKQHLHQVRCIGTHGGGCVGTDILYKQHFSFSVSEEFLPSLQRTQRLFSPLYHLSLLLIFILNVLNLMFGLLNTFL